MSRRARLLACTAVAAALSLGLGGRGAQAQSQNIWTGTGADANWSSGNFSLPLFPGQDLLFLGSNQLENVRDSAAPDSYSSITFNSGAGAFVLGGLATTVTSSIYNSSSTNQTIAFDALRVNGILNVVADTGAITIESPVLFSTAGGMSQRIVFSGSENTTLNGLISEESLGARGALSKSGSGTLTLGNAENTYSGGTLISAGTLAVTSSGSLGTGMVTLANGILSISGTDQTLSQPVYTMSLLRGIEVVGVTVTEAGGISGPGGLFVTGSGVLALTSANTYTGGTFISGGGTVSISNEASLGTGGLTLNGGRLTLSASQTLTKTIALSGTNTINTETVDATISGVISGSGTLTKTGDGTLFLTGANTYSGTTTISGGTISAGTNGAFGSSLINLQGGTLAYTGTSLNKSIVFTGVGGNIQIDGTTTSTFNVDLSGDGGFTKTGTGTLVLEGVSFYNGPTTIAAGTLRATDGDVLAHNSAFSVSAGARLLLDPGVAGLVRGLSGAGTVEISADAILTVDVPDTVTNTFSGSIIGLGSFEKEDLGTLLITGAGNDIGGNLVVCCGTLDIKGGAFQVGQNITVGGGLLRVSEGGTLNGDLLLVAAEMEVSGGATVTVRDYTQIGVGGGGERLTVTNATLDSQGEAQILGAMAPVTATVSGSTGLWSIATDLTIGIGQGGAKVLTVTDGARVTVGGTVSIDEYSRIELGNGGLAGSLTATSISNNGGIYANFTDTLTLGMPITGTGFLVKDGSGTLIISNTNDYSGSTSVEAGTLVVSGTLGSGDVNVQSGGTLRGSGTIGGMVTVLDGGILAPGSSPGTLTVGGLTLNNSSILDYELGAPGVVGGGVNDLVNVTGALALDGILNIRPQAGFATGTYRLMNYGSLASDGGVAFGDVPAGYEFTVSATTPGEVNLTVDYTGLQFWNGGQTTPNGAVNGGSGIWSDGGTNWTNQAGVVATSWAALTAVFAGPSGGIVTLTSDQEAKGLQFATDGYILGGPGALIVGADGMELRIDGGLGATIGNTVTGSGGLTKTGAGTITLSGTSSYTGGTTLNAGVLSVSADLNLGAVSGGLTFNGGTLATTASFASARDVTLNTTGAFAVGAATTLTLSGGIGGSGALVKQGGGTLLLTGASTYAGGTLVSAGTLQVGNGGTTGSLGGGNVVNNGSIVFNRSDLVTYAGDMTGTGTLRQDGPGTLIITGTIGLSGTTTVASGILQLGDGGTSGAVLGTIQNNGVLVFNRSDTYEVSNLIMGSGILGFTGGGTAVFTGEFRGSVAVAESGLVLTGPNLSLANVIVGERGVLSGNGTIGQLTVDDGGVVAPGNSPGTIAVNGPVAFNAGSTYRVDVTPSGAHDLITSTGAVTLDSGAVVQVVAEPGRYTPRSTFAILTTTDTLTGTFGSVSTDFAFLTPTLSYDAQNVYLSLLYNGVSFSTFGQTPNQIATATGAQPLGFGNAVFEALLGLPDASVPGALNALSGEAYASVGTVLQQQSVYVRDAVGTRLRQSLTAPGVSPLAYGAGPQTAALGEGLTPTLWAQGYGGWGNSFSNGNAATISNSIGGFLIGADVALAPNVRAGLFGGFSQSQFDVADRSSTGSMNNVDLGLYAGAQFGAIALRGGASYTWHDVSTNRTVAFPGFSQAVEGGYNTGTTQVFGEVGYDMAVGAYAFEPFAGLAYVHVAGASLTEGGGAAALSASMGGMDTRYSTLGLRLATSMQMWGSTLTPRLTVGWQHAFGDTTSTATMQFLGGMTPFSVTGVPIAEDALLLEAGLSYALSDKATLGASYTSQLASTAAQNAFTAQFSLKF